MREYKLGNKITAELIGTFGLVFGGCGTAIFAGHFVGNLGVALAFGLTVLCFAYAFASISGAHFNPAVTVGVWVAGRMETKDVIPYIVAQLIGGILAACVLFVLLKGSHTPDLGNFAANGYGVHSPLGYSMLSAFVAEFVLTLLFLVVILGVTDQEHESALAAPLAIGLMLTLIHLISIPITNTSVNPARSLSQALFVGGWALEQLWLFWVAPLLGGVAGALLYKFVKCSCPKNKETSKS